MNELEAKGLLWASGPFVQPGVLVGDGLTIFRTEGLEEARKLIEDEPLTRRGLRTYEIHTWELREGKITVDLNASKSTCSARATRSSASSPSSSPGGRSRGFTAPVRAVGSVRRCTR